MGKTPDETIEIERLARGRGRDGFVGFQSSLPPWQYAKQLIDEGRLGKLTARPRFALLHVRQQPSGLLTWRFEYDRGGSGVLGDIMSHVADMAHMLVCPIDAVVSNRHTFITDRSLPIPGRAPIFPWAKRAISTGAVSNEGLRGHAGQVRQRRAGQLRKLSCHLRPQVRNVRGQRDQGRGQVEFLRAHERTGGLPA
ncbi:MAG: hypothetical protein R3A10_07625 [Caldilineaceae bacterium]